MVSAPETIPDTTLLSKVRFTHARILDESGEDPNRAATLYREIVEDLQSDPSPTNTKMVAEIKAWLALNAEGAVESG